MSLIPKGSLEQWNAMLKDPSPMSGASVLIADRNQSGQRHIKDELTSLGVTNIEVCASPTEFYRMLQERMFNFVFLDQSLDEKRDGLYLIEEIHQLKLINPETALVILSSDRSSSTLFSISGFEPDDILIRPFSASEFSKRTARLFAKKFALRPLSKAISNKHFEKVADISSQLRTMYPPYRKDIERIEIELLLGSQDIAAIEQKLHNAVGTDFAWYHLAQAFLLQLQNKKSDAESALRDLVSDASHYVKATEQLAIHYMNEGQYESALFSLESSSYIITPTVSRLRFMAMLSFAQGNELRAKSYLTRAMDKSSGSKLCDLGDFVQYQKFFPDTYQDDTARFQSKLKYAFDTNEMQIVDALVLYFSAGSLKEDEKKTLDTSISQFLPSLSDSTLLWAYRYLNQTKAEIPAINRAKSALSERNLSPYNRYLVSNLNAPFLSGKTEQSAQKEKAPEGA